MTGKTLFSSYQLGNIELANRIVMAPLTRNRAGKGLVPSEFAADYYAQRASAGLIITEATQVSPQAQGYQDTPGLYTSEQIDAWRKVTDAVHAKSLFNYGMLDEFPMLICNQMGLVLSPLQRFGQTQRLL